MIQFMAHARQKGGGFKIISLGCPVVCQLQILHKGIVSIDHKAYGYSGSYQERNGCIALITLRLYFDSIRGLMVSVNNPVQTLHERNPLLYCRNVLKQFLGQLRKIKSGTL